MHGEGGRWRKGGGRFGEVRGEGWGRDGETRQQLTHAGELVTHKPSADTILHFD